MRKIIHNIAVHLCLLSSSTLKYYCNNKWRKNVKMFTMFMLLTKLPCVGVRNKESKKQWKKVFSTAIFDEWPFPKNVKHSGFGFFWETYANCNRLQHDTGNRSNSIISDTFLTHLPTPLTPLSQPCITTYSSAAQENKLKDSIYPPPTTTKKSILCSVLKSSISTDLKARKQIPK